MNYIDRLKTEVDALAKLLADPHPGLSTWVDLTDRRIAAVRDMTEPKG